MEENFTENIETTIKPLDNRSLKETADLLSLEYVETLDDPEPPREMIYGDFDRIAGSWGRQFLTVPIGEKNGVIQVATSNPLNIDCINQLQICYQKPVNIIVCPPEEVSKAINAIRTSLMKKRGSELSTKEDKAEETGQLKIDVTDAEDDDAPIIRYVNAIIFKASSERASDVHIEPYENEVNVRFRVDGVLSDVSSEDKSFQAAIISRIKIMSGLNIAEKRLPQDGRIGLKIAGKDVDIRVSTVPTQFGERVVLRLLDKSGTVLDLEQAGLEGRNLAKVIEIIKKPNGIILVTGPTGSGKTTTLYSALTKINTPDLNILTVEDPIEYQLDGVGQMQVNPKINFTFASGLRAILRQDPDVVMVGEIRDSETAEIAIQASLTGHLVFSTLHTNDAPGAITRLLDMGTEPFLVSSSLLGVMGQRLVRQLCTHCRIEYPITDKEIGQLGVTMQDLHGATAFKPGNTECEYCQNTGYLGRTGIHELLMIDDSIRELILLRKDSSSIRNAAIKNGFRTLRMDGASKVVRGITSIEEVMRVTVESLS